MKLLNKMKTGGALWTVLSIFQTVCTISPPPSREKRYIVYPYPGSKVEVITGFGVPIAFDLYSLTMGTKFKYNYPLPTNLSEYTYPYVTYQRRELRGPTRWEVYNILETTLERFNVDGRACVLLMICEAAQIPLNRESGLLEELTHVFFAPSESEGEQYREYVSAERQGAAHEAPCRQLYPECTTSFLDLVTEWDLG